MKVVGVCKGQCIEKQSCYSDNYFLFFKGMSPRKPYECDSVAAADIMLLVDGSWSIGRTNFRRVRDFLEGLVTPFNIGPDYIQIGR